MIHLQLTHTAVEQKHLTVPWLANLQQTQWTAVSVNAPPKWCISCTASCRRCNCVREWNASLSGRGHADQCQWELSVPGGFASQQLHKETGSEQHMSCHKGWYPAFLLSLHKTERECELEWVLTDCYHEVSPHASVTYQHTSSFKGTVHSKMKSQSSFTNPPNLDEFLFVCQAQMIQNYIFETWMSSLMYNFCAYSANFLSIYFYITANWIQSDWNVTQFQISWCISKVKDCNQITIKSTLGILLNISSYSMDGRKSYIWNEGK